jgi:hypothetical protein
MICRIFYFLLLVTFVELESSHPFCKLFILRDISLVRRKQLTY